MASILMLHGSSDLYGASKIFLQSAAALQAAGHRVTVVLSEDGPLVQALRHKGLEVHIHKLGILRRKYFNLPGLVNRVLAVRKAQVFLEKLGREKRITHLYSNTSAVLVGAMVARRIGAKHIWHLHEILVQPAWFAKLMGKVVGKSADTVLAVSQAVKDHWQPYMDQSKIHLLYNGIDYQAYLQKYPDALRDLNIPEKRLRIGMIGRINNWKGQGYFLEIVAKLLAENPNLHFIIAGDAFPGMENLVEEMLQKIKDLGLEKNVSYLGFREDIPALMQSLDLFVLPSILPDPFPTVILEAMASGKPVAATAHGGACEMLQHDETGILIPWNDADKAARLIQSLLENPEKMALMGEKGRKRVLEKFSTEAFERRFVKFFEDEG
jgi:glycosyltransferase involved in cell wall biosynthesis